jgi:signal transduction histidine kinase
MRWTWLSSILLMPFFAAAQYNVEVYSPAQGLVDAKVNRMYQDSLGRIFFLTRDGFSVYDGKQMKNFTEVEGHTVGVALSIIELAKNDVLILTLGQTVFRYKQERISVDTLTFRPCNELREAYPVGANAWIIESSKGFFLFQQQKLSPLLPFLRINQLNQFYTEALGVHKELLVVLEKTTQANIIYLFDWHRRKFIHRTSLPKEAYAFTGVNDGIHYLYKQALYTLRFSQSDGFTPEKPKPLPLQKGVETNRPINFRYGRLWMQKSKDLISAIAPTGNETDRYELISNGSDFIYDVFKDREQNLWLLSSGKGALKLEAVRFKESALAYQVKALCQWKDSLYVIDAQRKVFLKTTKGTKWIGRLPANALDFVFRCGSDLCFIKETSIQSLSGKRMALPVNKNEIHDYFFSNLASYDESGNALISGLYFFRITPEGKVSSIRLPYYCDNIVSTGGNTYWAFCRNDAALQIQYDNGALKVVKQWSVPGLNARFTYVLDQHNFMIGTRNDGVVYFRHNAKGVSILKKLRQQDGLSNNFVSHITRISDSSFALSTSSGLDLIRYTKGDTIIERISATDNFFSQISETKWLNDTLWVKSLYGHLFNWKPEPHLFQFAQPHLYLSAVRFNGGLAAEGQTSFAYDQNNFRFEASAPSFINSRDIVFNFRLQGPEQQWVRRSNEPVFEINNLEPGQYHLSVTVSFPARHYPDQQLAYEFTVLAPFWQTAWFRVLFALACIALIVLVVSSIYSRKLVRQRAALERNQAIEKERTRIATDMHDDLGAGLSRIKFLSEKLKFHQEATVFATDLNKISSYSDEMAEKMGEIVWALNQRFDSAGDLVAFCRAYASELLEEKKIAFQFSAQVANDKRLNGELRRNIFLVVKEALHNIIKHAGATEVEMRFEINTGLLIQIADNGKGFDVHHLRPFSNGVENMRKRMEEIGGTIEFTNHAGTKVAIHLPSLP